MFAKAYMGRKDGRSPTNALPRPSQETKGATKGYRDEGIFRNSAGANARRVNRASRIAPLK
ncbi:MAG: hypothetical protein QOJ51_1299 [Acidobacteriaceae bacterium]|jgi:hypothetical protein|nr:hypothetical protein [Acidobacteriaceae bacterium]